MSKTERRERERERDEAVCLFVCFDNTLHTRGRAKGVVGLSLVSF